MKREQVRLIPVNGPGKPVHFLGKGHGDFIAWGEYLPIAFSRMELNALPQTNNGSGIVITKYKGAGGSVTIPATIAGKKVTAIGERAFADSGMTTAVIPEGVTEIGSMAFAGCQFLTDVVLPKSLTAIRSGAFYYCGKLQNITIPGSVTTVEGGVFIGCNNLSEATVTAIIARFGSDPFAK